MLFPIAVMCVVHFSVPQLLGANRGVAYKMPKNRSSRARHDAKARAALARADEWRDIERACETTADRVLQSLLSDTPSTPSVSPSHLKTFQLGGASSSGTSPAPRADAAEVATSSSREQKHQTSEHPAAQVSSAQPPMQQLPSETGNPGSRAPDKSDLNPAALPFVSVLTGEQKDSPFSVSPPPPTRSAHLQHVPVWQVMENMLGEGPEKPYVMQMPYNPKSRRPTNPSQHRYEEYIRSAVQWPAAEAPIAAHIARALFSLYFPHTLDYSQMRDQLNAYLPELACWCVAAAQRIVELEQQVQKMEATIQRLNAAASWMPRSHENASTPKHQDAHESDADENPILQAVRRAQAQAKISRPTTPVWTPYTSGRPSRATSEAGDVSGL